MKARLHTLAARSMVVTLLAISVAPAALAQHAHHGKHAGAVGDAPYAGMQARSIKALSDQQLDDLRAGRGMALALPAELNGYPGPAHVLELAQPLQLSADQAARTQALFARMQEEARVLGERLIEEERALDRLFADGKAKWAQVEQATHRAAQAQGALRAAHLKFHLLMMDVLDEEQVARYGALRGYR